MEKAQGKASTATKKPQASKAQVTPEVVKEAPQEVVSITPKENNGEIVDQRFFPSESTISQLWDAETGQNLTQDYRRQEDWAKLVNKPIRGFYQGVKQIHNDEGELIDAICFDEVDQATRQITSWMAAQMILVQSFKNQKIPIGTPCQIIFTGKVNNKTTKGSTNKFDVKSLILKN